MPGENQNQPTPAAEPAKPAAPVAADPAKPAGETPAPAAAATPPGDAPVLTPDDKTKPAEPAKPSTAPEKYDFKAPEGKALDQAAIDAYTPIFKEMGLTQDQAQKLVDTSFGIADAHAKAFDASVQEALAKQTAEWRAESTSKYSEADRKIANRAFNSELVTPELRAYLWDNGLADNPHLVGHFLALGKKLGESQAPSPGDLKPNGAPKSAGHGIYTTMTDLKPN